MDFVLILHALSTWALFGLIWAVQLALYPLFAKVGKDGFASYHAAHMRGIGLVVAPLMLIELATAVWLFLAVGVRDPLFLASLVGIGIVWGSTAFIQVPAHRKLEREGFDQATGRRLTKSNWIRTAAWTARAVLVAIWLA